MKKTTKKEQEKMKALGLLTIARESSKKIDMCIDAMADIMKLPGKDSYDKGGWILSDNCWEDGISSFLEAFEKNYKS